MTISKNANNKWITSLDSEREFHIRMDAINHERTLEIRQKQKVNLDNRRLTELIDLWHQLHGKALKDGLRRYKMLYRIAERLGDPVAISFQSEEFAHYRQERALEVSTGTLNREHSYLRAVFNELRRLGVIKYDNPLSHMRQFKEKEHDLRFLTGHEITQLLEACESSSNRSLTSVVKLCLATGARWGEAENLKASQLANGQVTFLDTKGGRKKRSVPISDELGDELHELGKAGDERLFIGCLGAFRKAISDTDIHLPKGQLTHVLRHTFASHFVMNGGNIVVLKDILGHSTITTTMRYSHLAPDYLNDAVSLNPLVNPAN